MNKWFTEVTDLLYIKGTYTPGNSEERTAVLGELKSFSHELIIQAVKDNRGW